ncbi:MAG: cytochrome P450 [Acidobacteriota bacterium]
MRAAASAPLMPGLPVLGSSLDAFRDPCGFFASCHRHLGPVFRVKYPGKTLLMMAGIAANRFFALEGARVFSNAETYRRVSREMGTTTYPNAHDGDSHRDLRRLLAPSLSAQAIERYLPRIFDAIRETARGWPRGRPIPLHRAIGPLVADIVSICTTNRTLGERLARDVNLWSTMMGVVGVGAAFPEATLYFPPVQRARRRFARFLEEAIADHRARGPGTDRMPDVLDALIALAASTPSTFDPATLLALAMLPSKNSGIYLYRMLSFALYEILRRPEVESLVRAEVDGVFERRSPRVEDLRQMPTLRGVILEALRLYPLAVALPRAVSEPYDFEGYHFPAGVTVYIAGPVTHFAAEFFPSPERFDPDRHLPGRDESRRPHVFAPFGLGPHACAARAYALTVGAAVVAGLVRHVELGLAPKGYAIRVRGFPSPIPEARFRIVSLGPREPPPPASEAPFLLEESLTERLGQLDAGDRAAVMKDLHEETFAAGTTVFRQGDAADRIYLVRRGEAEVVVEERGGEPRVVARLGAGELFGEMGLLQGIPRTATVRVGGEAELAALSLGRDAFNHLAVDGDFTSGELVRLMQKRELLTQLARALPRLDLASTAKLGAVCRTQSFGPGEVVIKQGDRAEHFYVLTQGTVEVVQTHPDGSEVIVAWLDPVDYFGEIGLLEGRPRTATVRAAPSGAVRVLALDLAQFGALIEGCEGTREEMAQVASARLLALAQGPG